MGFTYAASYQLSKFVAHSLFDLRVYGQENIIEEGPALLAMNHQSFLDPPFAGISCQRPIHYLGRKTLFDIPVIGAILRRINVIGVDREGSDVAALKAVMRVLKSGGCTIVFPEGTRTLDGSLQAAKPGAGFIIAEDAHVVDSSHLTIDGVVGEIIGRLKLKGLALPDGA